MKGVGEILLISCYELGHQPVGLASPLGFLEEAGYRPLSVDLSVEKLDPDKVKQARFIGISVPMHTALRIGIKVAEEIRKINSTCHLCFFGLYSSLNGETLLKTAADSVIGGEYEGPLVALVDRLSAGGDDFQNDPIAGLRRRGETAAPLLDYLPFVTPSRSALPLLDRYASLESNGGLRKAGAVEASRGCRHLCRHCPIPPVYEGRFFLVPSEIVLEDIRNLVAMGAEHITFGDPDFLNGPNHSLRIVRAMHQEFPKVTFDLTAKVEHIIKHRTLFPELASLGCVFVVSAVESLNDEVLGHLAKNHTRADVVEALRIAQSAGITLRPSLVTFTPWSSLEEIIDLFEFVEKEGLIDTIDPVQYTIRLLIPPGSLLLTEPSMAPHLGPLVPESFTYQWRHSDPRIDRLQLLFSKEVEQATADEIDPESLFFQLKEIALATQEERAPRRINHPFRPGRSHPPRLTEPWFCCAEPTEIQFAILKESEKLI